MNLMQVWFDGASRSNPGEAGCGAVFQDPSGKRTSFRKYLGIKTNNVAEYEGLLSGLDLVKQFLSTSAPDTGELALHITGDSELVIKQLKGEYRVRHPNIVPLYSKVQQKLEELRQYGLQNIVYQRIPRKENSEADTLANEAIDQATGL